MIKHLQQTKLLNKALLKAQDNGYRLDLFFEPEFNEIMYVDEYDKLTVMNKYEILCDQDFARALWGTKWAHYLVIMILQDDPFTWLDRQIKGEFNY
ncbi:MAG: hypothetical protein ACR2IQ_02715 [Minisyncoccia bacterium]